MAINQGYRHVTTRNERRDEGDGWERGYDSPYPKDNEEAILANIERVSPSFVAGYKKGKQQALYEDWKSHEGDDEWLEGTY